jgi:hypothetical protein
MKQTLFKKLARSAAMLIAVVLVGASAQTAFAGWNDAGSGDCQTFSIGNVTTGQGIASPCWTTTSISGKTGDTINVKVYFHNTGSSPITNATVSISNPGTGVVSGSQSFTGALKVGGSTVASGNGNVTITSGGVKFRLSRVTIQRQSTGGAIETLANPQDVLTSNGISLGTVAPGWNGQGALKAVFVLDDAGTNPCTSGCNQNGQAPTVTTNAANPISNQLGNATLNGFFNSNGAETFTAFHYRLVGSSNWITRDMQNRGISSGNLQYTLTNLSAGTYEFEAVATNQYGQRSGGIMNFTIGNGSTSCGTGYYWNGSTCVQNIPNCGTNQYWNGSYCVTNIPNCSYNQYWNGSSCVNNIPTCSYNQYWNGSSCVNNIPTCSYNQYWNGSQCVNNTVINTTPTVTTLGTISIANTSVAVDGYYTSTTCDVYTRFNYGITQNLGSVTGEVNRGTGSGSMAQSFAGLASNTTYYYQAAVRNCQGSAVGEIRSFRTTQTTTNNTNTTTFVNTTNIGGGNSMVRLMIDNQRDTVRGGTEIAYDVSWENISGRELNDLVLQVNFPSQMTILDTDRGSIERNQNSVIYEIESLEAREEGEMTIIVQINSGLREGDPVVAQAIAAFENPRTSATENAIAYDADTFSTAGSVLGASIFGLNFLPNSLVGWLIILLIILLIIIIVRTYTMRNRAAVVAINNQSPRPMDAGAPGATPGNDYIVYRPNPKQ